MNNLEKYKYVFTREDILKIQQALFKVSVKDSELPNAEVNTKLQGLVWSELVKLVKSKVETNNKELLSKQLELIGKLKAKIVEEDTRELDLFNEFKEYSKTHPNATYNEFLKSK